VVGYDLYYREVNITINYSKNLKKPSLYFSVIFQALLRAALPQQNAMILVFMAVDRYTCMLHPEKYHKHSSKKVSYEILIIK